MCCCTQTRKTMAEGRGGGCGLRLLGESKRAGGKRLCMSVPRNVGQVGLGSSTG